MTHEQISDAELDALLSAPQTPIVDNGFTEQTLMSIKKRAILQAAIPLSMGLVGAVITAVTLPSGWLSGMFADVSIISASENMVTNASRYGLIGGLFVVGGLLAVMFASMSNQNK